MRDDLNPPDRPSPPVPAPPGLAAPRGEPNIVGARGAPDGVGARGVPKGVEFKAGLLLGFLLLLLIASVAYVMYARGAFEATQRLVLVADDADGVRVGMDLTFAGFPIGRVADLSLGDDGSARINIDLAKKDAHRLRTSSVFTLVRSLVGGTAIKAYTGVPTDPPLAAGAERPVLVGDATSEIPQLVADARAMIQNLSRMTAADSALSSSLAHVQTLTRRVDEQGLLAVALGSEEQAKKVGVTLDRTNALLARLDGVLARADRQVLGEGGLVTEVQATVTQLRAALGDARTALDGVKGTLAKVDGVLVEAQGAASNVRAATVDLGDLRAEVDASLRKVQHLIDDINRRWPFARDSQELKLP